MFSCVKATIKIIGSDITTFYGFAYSVKKYYWNLFVFQINQMIIIICFCRERHQHSIYPSILKMAGKPYLFLNIFMGKINKHMVVLFLSHVFYSINGQSKKIVCHFRNNYSNSLAFMLSQTTGIRIWMVI